MDHIENKNARVIAYYLPQFHPIPENDQWWGKGFTEWTNVGKSKPLFKGHYQPRVPADLGYYDLRLPEVREEQARMAREAGVEGFCYWHYWFGNGRRLLERIFDEVLETGKPNFPFCLGWANHSWTTKTWESKKGFTSGMIAEQVYPGTQDYIDHFNYVLKAFKDERYITVDEKPIFVIFDPHAIPNCNDFINLWQRLAIENGFKGIHFVGNIQNTSNIKKSQDGRNFELFPIDRSEYYYNSVINLGFDAVASVGMWRAEAIMKGRLRMMFHRFCDSRFGISRPQTFDYADLMENYYVDEDAWENVYPSIVPQWDRSPRAGKLNGIYVNSTPENFEKVIRRALTVVKDKDEEHKILFLKSWNEWAEGNYVEPDLKYGHGYLDALRNTIIAKTK